MDRKVDLDENSNSKSDTKTGMSWFLSEVERGNIRFEIMRISPCA